MSVLETQNLWTCVDNSSQTFGWNLVFENVYTYEYVQGYMSPVTFHQVQEPQTLPLLTYPHSAQ